MAFYAVKGEFVAGSTAAEGGFCPATDFDARVGADDGIALFCEGRVGRGGAADHRFGEVVFRGCGGGVTFCDGANVFNVQEGGFLGVFLFVVVRFDVFLFVVVGFGELRWVYFGQIREYVQDSFGPSL